MGTLARYETPKRAPPLGSASRSPATSSRAGQPRRIPALHGNVNHHSLAIFRTFALHFLANPHLERLASFRRHILRCQYSNTPQAVPALHPTTRVDPTFSQARSSGSDVSPADSSTSTSEQRTHLHATLASLGCRSSDSGSSRVSGEELQSLKRSNRSSCALGTSGAQQLRR